jgi:large subunit ribosomal protein L18
LNLVPTGKFVTAQLEHFENDVVIEASTNEWAIKQQLYKTSDMSAYVNLARVFAQRCLEGGIIEMNLDSTLKNSKEGTKTDAFLKTLKDNGIILKETGQLRPQKQVDFFKGRKEKPYGEWQEY